MKNAANVSKHFLKGQIGKMKKGQYHLERVKNGIFDIYNDKAQVYQVIQDGDLKFGAYTYSSISAEDIRNAVVV